MAKWEYKVALKPTSILNLIVMIENSQNTIESNNTLTQSPVKSAQSAAVQSVVVAAKPLSRADLEKVASIKHRYEDDAEAIVLHFKSKRGGQWSKFVELSDAVNNSDGQEKIYLTTLTEMFDLNELVTKNDIVQHVCSARAQHQMPTFTSNITTSCLKEFDKVFIYEDRKEDRTDENGDTSKVHVGIIPIFAILAS
ncbi:hypothetical protein LLH06_16660 [Mucilaginibacter daejeonensis]|uniref:hypothetical protein n=1 Tax=Mucilaginibacter daejeonensis TaxID=398049 RepID=UPI001D1733C1|nr:hypothetical protein [Mucilaginibacter daejeonensis]UEG52588.1 hypothetical protein LLH06_16660 [Mucilaginibacter daejeonensis]